jgi:hypothetical protein
MAEEWMNKDTTTPQVVMRATSEIELNMRVYVELAAKLAVEFDLDKDAVRDLMIVPCSVCQTVDKYGNRLCRMDQTFGFSPMNCKSFCPRCIDESDEGYYAQFIPPRLSSMYNVDEY